MSARETTPVLPTGSCRRDGVPAPRGSRRDAILVVMNRTTQTARAVETESARARPSTQGAEKGDGGSGGAARPRDGERGLEL